MEQFDLLQQLSEQLINDDSIESVYNSSDEQWGDIDEDLEYCQEFLKWGNLLDELNLEQNDYDSSIEIQYLQEQIEDLEQRNSNLKQVISELKNQRKKWISDRQLSKKEAEQHKRLQALQNNLKYKQKRDRLVEQKLRKQEHMILSQCKKLYQSLKSPPKLIQKEAYLLGIIS